MVFSPGTETHHYRVIETPPNPVFPSPGEKVRIWLGRIEVFPVYVPIELGVVNERGDTEYEVDAATFRRWKDAMDAFDKAQEEMHAMYVERRVGFNPWTFDSGPPNTT